MMPTKNQDIPKDVTFDGSNTNADDADEEPLHTEGCDLRWKQQLMIAGVYKTALTLSGNMVKRDMDMQQLSRICYVGTLGSIDISPDFETPITRKRD
jgi:hypothetical protein